MIAVWHFPLLTINDLSFLTRLLSFVTNKHPHIQSTNDKDNVFVYGFVVSFLFFSFTKGKNLHGNARLPFL